VAEAWDCRGRSYSPWLRDLSQVREKTEVTKKGKEISSADVKGSVKRKQKAVGFIAGKKNFLRFLSA